VNAPDVALLLHDWKNGDEHAIKRLTTIVYDELRRLAVHYLRDEHAVDTLQPTALVHEAYIRLVPQTTPDWAAHIFSGLPPSWCGRFLSTMHAKPTARNEEPERLWFNLTKR
jgi:hypothetical protein